MSRYVLAGGGTAGHVNPLLAVADALRARDSAADVVVVGTAEGLESRLVPARGYELYTIEKIPFPRRPNVEALTFFPRFRRAVRQLRGLLHERDTDVVVGFGGYASAPAYSAARRARVPLVIHEANAKPGMANRLGARYTPWVGVAFPHTPVPNARFVGMPLRHEIETLDRAITRPAALEFFGLDPERVTVLVTGGSLGARSINATVVESARALTDAGAQVLHIVGGTSEVRDPGIPHFHMIEYCDRMDLALALADLALSRAGSATVSELAALGIPAVYVPYPVGNGEQRFNARGVVDAGGGILVDDKDFTPEWVRTSVVPLIGDTRRRESMALAARGCGVRDGTQRMLTLIDEALGQ